MLSKPFTNPERAIFRQLVCGPVWSEERTIGKVCLRRIIQASARPRPKDVDGTYEVRKEAVGNGFDGSDRARFGRASGLIVVNVEEDQARLVALGDRY